MATKLSNIQILRSDKTTAPASLLPGELAYSFGAKKLYIGSFDGTQVLEIGADQNKVFKDAIDALNKKTTTITYTDPAADGEKGTITIGDTNTIVKITNPTIAKADGTTKTLDEVINEAIRALQTTIVKTAATDIKVESSVDNGVTTYTLSLPDIAGLDAREYGSATAVPVVTVDKKGRITAITTAAVSSDLVATDGTTEGTINLISDKLTVSGSDGAAVTFNPTSKTFDVKVDSTVVRTTGDQTISGVKTFSTAPKVGSGSSAVNVATVDDVQDALDNIVSTAEGIVVKTTDGFHARKVTSTELVVTNGDGKAGDITLGFKNSGVAAGTYNKVTVDAKGIVTSGENEAVVLKDVTTAQELAGVLKYSSAAAKSIFTEGEGGVLITKEYADNIAMGLVYHDAVDAYIDDAAKLGAYAAGTDSKHPGMGATLTVTGITLPTVGKRVLVNVGGEAGNAHNGVYTVKDTTTLTRAADLDGYPAAGYKGASFLVLDGTRKGEVWRLTNEESVIEFGTTKLHFSQAFAPTSIAAGGGINVNGATVSANVDNKSIIIDTTGKIAVGQSTAKKAGQTLVTKADGSVEWVDRSSLDINSINGVLDLAHGGTGHSNTSTKAITIGDITLKTATNSVVNVPATGTLATLAGSEELENKTLVAANVKTSLVGTETGGTKPSIEGFIIDCGTY